nr:ATP synthase F0 subunit 8 [Symploce tubercularis]
MPQMMPLSWLSLYMFFSLMLLMFNFINYYSHIPYPSLSNKKVINIKTFNWKW